MVTICHTRIKDYETEKQTNLADFGIIAHCAVEKTQTSLLDFPMEYDRPLNPITQVFIDILRIEKRFEETS
jgi:hypothetical protein